MLEVPRQETAAGAAYKFSFAGPGSNQLLKGLATAAGGAGADADLYSLAMDELPPKPKWRRRRSHHCGSQGKEIQLEASQDIDVKSAASYNCLA